jgi:hypothetical protein
VFVCLVVPLFARAQVINEIFYSPTSKQWVEIYNSTEGDIDLSQYKILDGGAAVNGHSISAAQTGGSTILPSHEYGVVAKDVGSISSTYIFKSSLGIKTAGDTISIKKGSSVVDTAQFSDNATASGESLQKFDAGWSVSIPTPGSVNVLQIDDGNSDTESTSTATTTESNTTAQNSNTNTSVTWSSHYSFVSAQNDTTVKLTVSAGRERLTTTGEPLHFKAVLNTNDPNTNYEWNFGDGSIGKGKDIDHAYLLAGDYVVVLNATLFDNEAVSRTKVKVVKPEISIDEVTKEYVSVKNNSKYEINLYGWQLEGESNNFPFPKDTIIAPVSVVKFPLSNIGLDAVGLVKISRFSDKKEVTTINAEDIGLKGTKVQADAAQIQAISERLFALNKQLAEMAKEQTTLPIKTDKGKSLPSVANTASAINAILGTTTAAEHSTVTPIRSQSWYEVVKKFFLGNR